MIKKKNREVLSIYREANQLPGLGTLCVSLFIVNDYGYIDNFSL